MISNLDRYKKDLERLISTGHKLEKSLIIVHKKKQGDKTKDIEGINEHTFSADYQGWYTESFQVIKQLLPDRLNEFESLYRADEKRKNVNVTNYKIQDWLRGSRATDNEYTGKKHFDDFGVLFMNFQMQASILEAVKMRFESTLFDIKQLLQADLFDSEISAARELVKNGFLRGGGAMAGVVLEQHLEQVCSNHSISITKKDPSISSLNDLLKNDNVFDTPNWRFIQRLGDLRNLCDHNKEREPTKEELNELVDGVEKILKTIF